MLILCDDKPKAWRVRLPDKALVFTDKEEAQAKADREHVEISPLYSRDKW